MIALLFGIIALQTTAFAAEDCRTSTLGVDYDGDIHTTISGRTCQRWDSQKPHTHSFKSVSKYPFPDQDLKDAGNNCRNPDYEADGPWCYTADNKKRYEFCDVKRCSNDAIAAFPKHCKKTGKGKEYQGKVNVTRTGLTCQRWDAQSPQKHTATDPSKYPDKTLADAANYCRNPWNDDGPWCYTTDPARRWEYCDFTLCYDLAEKDPEPATAKHVVFIGVDGLKPTCMNNAPGGNPNIMKRIAEKGTYTLTKARTVLNTVSASGWTANICAMDSTATGVTSNGWTPTWKGNTQPITPVTGKDTPFPCVYQIIKQQNPKFRTAAWYSWSWLKYLHNEAVPRSVDDDYYCSDSDYKKCDARITAKASAYLKRILPKAPGSYTFIYLGSADVAGHGKGWCGTDYLNAVATIDKQIGTILDAIDAANMQDKTLVMLSTDHAADRYSHGGKNDNNLNIPIMLRGPKIKKNNLFKNQVYNKDVVPTALYALGLKPSVNWQGKVMTEAFE